MSLGTCEIGYGRAVQEGGDDGETHLILRHWKVSVLLQLLHP